MCEAYPDGQEGIDKSKKVLKEWAGPTEEDGKEGKAGESYETLYLKDDIWSVFSNYAAQIVWCCQPHGTKDKDAEEEGDAEGEGNDDEDYETTMDEDMSMSEDA